jgi:WhiB family redox-sensing transcriptional regulator
VVQPDRYSWHEDAACRMTDASLFFPVADEDSWRAKLVCRRCLVREDCLAFSLENHERYGVWGGMGEHERAELFRRGLVPRIAGRAVTRAS